nr:putative aldehyde dehydrogenase ycbD [Rhodococcus sp. JVH1]
MMAANLLQERGSVVASDLVREEGKTLAEARGKVTRAVDVLRFFGSLGWAATGEVLPSGLPGTSVTTRRGPLGVFTLITPWNFPIAIPAWKTAPALVSGNTVVFMPAELTPLSATHLARALHDAGLPAGVFNVVHGKGRVVGDALARDPRVAGLSFTGSTSVGLGLQDILNARRARVQLEMGGKNGVLVLDDARNAAQVVAAGAFGLTGQACTATSRVYVTPGIRDAFLDALVEEAARYVPGDGSADTTRMGAVVSSAQFEQDQAAVRSAVGRRRNTATRGLRRRLVRRVLLPGHRAHRSAARRSGGHGRDLRPGRRRPGGRRLRGRARRRQRLPLRTHRGNLHRQPRPLDGLRGPGAGRRRQDQPPDSRARPECAVRRSERFVHEHVPGAGSQRGGFLHLGEDRVHGRLIRRHP